MASAWMYTLIPAAAAVVGASFAAVRRPGPVAVSAVQHFAAGVVFAAAAGEILPDLLHRNSLWMTLVGGAIGVAAMLALKLLERKTTGASGLIIVTGVDVFIDGMVLGIGFLAGQSAGLLLTIALTIEVLFLGLTVSMAFAEDIQSRIKPVLWTAALVVLLPLGALLSIPASMLPQPIITGVFAFSLIALLYLVTEELLVEAHETPDRPWVTAMFFAGFLLLLLLEEAMK
ncbi:transporter [Rhodopseudomonas palustris]|uniref:Transporter n=1 Tax=Rhodopseudomonas palustris TaxID=1076 RepID=A0A323UYG1_RHOPL|nr:transporter [Rhodopseudomonas palustris]PZA12848.1 transporter [Rhodopseudomonas palustris]